MKASLRSRDNSSSREMRKGEARFMVAIAADSYGQLRINRQERQVEMVEQDSKRFPHRCGKQKERGQSGDVAVLHLD